MTAETFVLDASAVASILFDEPTGSVLDTRLEGGQLVAPTLLPYEIASVALAKSRQHATKEDAVRRALHLLGRIPLAYVAVPATSGWPMNSEPRW